MILVDHREDKEVHKLLKLHNVEHKIVQLDIADYIINNEIVIERKTIHDYSASLRSNHLFNQAYHMSFAYPRSYIAIIGSIYELYAEDYFSRESYLSSLASLNLRTAPDGCMGSISTVNFDTDEDFVLFIKYIHDKHRDVKFRTLSPLHKKKRDMNAMILGVVSQFPGIGENRARDILNECKTIEKIVNSPPEKLAEVPGIGKKISRTLYEFFRKPFSD